MMFTSARLRLVAGWESAGVAASIRGSFDIRDKALSQNS
jgi:hypothetical protein